MPLTFQDRITSADLHQHPGRLYLFGDNEARRGLGGLARICRGQCNALGIATKRFPSRAPDAYWSDTEFGRFTTIIDADPAPAFAHARAGGTVVCPTAGLGTGLAELPTRALRVFAHLRQRIVALKRVAPSSG